ncbi:MAG: stage II sporulation protein R, partial [Clostridia bacterium]|nr:stage II sporulation protein R [Clostridia bacterium]
LGTGAGDNWWCCIYPPLCFTGAGGKNIVYRSKLAEIIEAFFSQE